MNKQELFFDGLTKALKLSQHGLLKLQVFPTTIIASSYRKLQQQTKVPDKVKWLIRECDSQCKENGIRPEWAKYYDSIRSFGIDQNSPLVDIHDIQDGLFDFSKPVIKPVEIYSTRDLTKYKKEIKNETLAKGLEFLGSLLSESIRQDIKVFMEQNSNT